MEAEQFLFNPCSEKADVMFYLCSEMKKFVNSMFCKWEISFVKPCGLNGIIVFRAVYSHLCRFRLERFCSIL